MPVDNTNRMRDISSEWKPYSKGTVAENKDMGSKMILVTPIEATPSMTGELKSDPTRLEEKGTDAHGNAYETATNTDATIEAHWLQWGSNRITPPDVRRGERVTLWRFGDDDKFYWTTDGLDEHLRRLETVVYGFNADPNGTKDSAITPDNMYTLEISSHTKQATFRTSQANGEKTTFVMQFNMGEGTVTLVDGAGNFFQLDSLEAIFKMQNFFGTYLTIDKNTIDAFAADLIHCKTKAFNVECETFDLQATESAHIATQQFNMEATDNATIVSNNVLIDAPQTTITGDVKVGNISTGVEGNNTGMISQGDLEIRGSLRVTGTSRFDGHIQCVGIDSSGNVNAPNID